MKKFVTSSDYEQKEFETGGGEILVEKAGYVPAKQRIESLMMAGQRLMDIRQEAYDFADGNVDEDFVDPTRSPNYDMADASQQLRAVAQRKRLAIAVKASEKVPRSAEISSEPVPIPNDHG